MAIFFETPRFRVHITDTLAWIENREGAGWVLRGQVTIPVSRESLSAGAYPGMLAAAVLDFEESRPGDNSLRAALRDIENRRRCAHCLAKIRSGSGSLLRVVLSRRGPQSAFGIAAPCDRL